ILPFVEAKGSSVSSVIGRPSMSPRSSTTGASAGLSGWCSRRTATTDVVSVPVLISRSRPSRASRTAACVRGGGGRTRGGGGGCGGLWAGEVESDLGMGVQGAAQPLQLRQQAVGLGDEGVHERSPSVRWFRAG